MSPALAHRRRSRAVALTAAGVLIAACAAATRCEASSIEGIAGWEGDGFDQGYGFATLGGAVSGGAHASFPLRITGSYLYYDYRAAAGAVKVRGPGVGGMAGLRNNARPWGTISILAGGEVRWERRERQGSSGAGSAVARGGAVAQADGDFTWGRRLHPFLLVNYSGSARYVYGRAGLRWQISNIEWQGPLTWSPGIEGVGQGNADTDAVQAGATVECAVVRSRISVGARGGYKDSASPEGGRRHGAYVGVGLYRRF